MIFDSLSWRQTWPNHDNLRRFTVGSRSKTPNGGLPYVMTRVHSRSSSFVHHKVSGSNISRLCFNLKSLNFTGTSVPTYSTSTPDMMSLATSSWKLSRKNLSKTPLPTASVGISREPFKLWLIIFFTFYLYRETIDFASLPDITSLAASST